MLYRNTSATDLIALGSLDKHNDFKAINKENPLYVKVISEVDTNSTDMVELKKQLKEEITNSIGQSVTEETVDNKIQEAIRGLQPSSTGSVTVDKEAIKTEIINSIKPQIKNELSEEIKNEINPTVTIEDKEVQVQGVGAGSSASINSVGLFFENNDRIIGKVINKVGFNVNTAGTMHVYRLKLNGNYTTGTQQVSLLNENVINFTTTGEQWFDVNLGDEPFTENEFIAVTKIGTSTGKFHYGGNVNGGRGFKRINANAVTNGSSGVDLGIGYKELIKGYSYNENDKIKEAVGEEKEVLEITKDINTYKAISNTTGGYFIDNNIDYVGKVVKELGFYVEGSGVMYIARFKKPRQIVKEITINFTEKGRQWFPVDLGDTPFAEDEYIGVAKKGVTTGTFRYGGSKTGKSFITIGNSEKDINNITGTSDLNIGVKVLKKLDYGYNVNKKIFEGKRIGFTGDSITTLEGYITSGNAVYYNSSKHQDYDIRTIEDTWWGKLCELTGGIFTKNDAWSGSRVSGEGAGLAHGRTTEAKLGKNLDILFTMIGINDLNGNVSLGEFNPDSITLNTTNITNAYCKMINDLSTNFPSTKIIVLTPLRSFSNNLPKKNSNGLTVPALNKRIMEICDYYGVECINTGEIGITQNNFAKYLPDGLHPNRVGAHYIAEFLYRKLS